MLILGRKYYYNQLSDNDKINLDKILKKICLENIKIAVIGLGHVALPLAHAFSSKYKIVGFDIAHWRIDELRSSGYDSGVGITNYLLENSELYDIILPINKNLNFWYFRYENYVKI